MNFEIFSGKKNKSTLLDYFNDETLYPMIIKSYNPKKLRFPMK